MRFHCANALVVLRTLEGTLVIRESARFDSNDSEPKSFNVKLAFFTVFALTQLTGFAARWCFLFSANDSSIEQDCPPLVYIMCKEA